ncbi:GH25 family lysozyme [Priestia megaterium]|uniref:GH25 family lysozyme n=1 Tax=Priestia megaterium TaxID=1404 RepID=UPI002E2177CA|nr:GH25 family lysozyme [Priestia megaterium]MED3976180.1 GH25 family lysozyme [Priestia megaterium]
MGKTKIVDLSYWQGTIDFNKAKEELALAIIRTQYGSSKEDAKHKEYEAQCEKYGIPYGNYAYARFVSVADAVQEAKDFLARKGAKSKFLVVDVEEMTTKVQSDIVPATQAFIDYLHQNGVKTVGLYTGHSFYKTYGMSKVKADFLWIPRYRTNDDGQIHTVKPDMPCDIWQYSQAGTLAGVTGSKVDLNVLNGEKPLEFFTGVNENPAPPATIEGVKVYPYIAVTGDVWLHSTPDFNESSRVRVLKAGEIHTSRGSNNGLVNIGEGYVSEKYVGLTNIKTQTTGNVWTHSTPDFDESSRVKVIEEGTSWKTYAETTNGMYKIGSEYVSKAYMRVIS